MASILRVNTLTDASSNNSVPMATVASGSAKSNLSYDMSNDGTEHSFNVSSVTDRATGSIYSTFSNNMSSTSFTTVSDSSPSQVGSMGTGNGDRATISSADTSARASSNCYKPSNDALTDAVVLAVIVQGDLA
jgi:hypothetical protein|tara:strand:+ start:342 stop:740 length:399 start_codon:yes stop_codon:yes gene_type:complete